MSELSIITFVLGIVIGIGLAYVIIFFFEKMREVEKWVLGTACVCIIMCAALGIGIFCGWWKITIFSEAEPNVKNVTFVFQNDHGDYTALTRYQNRTIIESYIVEGGQSFMTVSDVLYSLNITYELAICDIDNSSELCGCSFHGGDTIVIHQLGNNNFYFVRNGVDLRY